jgi:peptide/nickel transport system substrate-binding protein
MSLARGLLVLLLALLAGCGKPVEQRAIRFAIAQAPLNLDPRYATDAASERLNRLIYRPLADFDAASRAVPALATWQALAPRHYRFSLGREGRVFHDGTPLTARDVVATYQSLLALKDAPHRAEFANIAGVQALDDNRVEFTLSTPDPEFPARLIIGILPAHLIAAGHDFSRHPGGSGPLRLMAWDKTVHLQRVADGLEFRIEEVRDPTVRVLKLLRGEIGRAHV